VKSTVRMEVTRLRRRCPMAWPVAVLAVALAAVLMVALVAGGLAAGVWAWQVRDGGAETDDPAESGAGPVAGANPRPAAAPPPSPPAGLPAPGWSAVDDFAYQLQNIDLAELGDSRFDLLVIDYSADGSHETRFSSAEIGTLKASPGGSKLVLAYMSIGEAEDYRWYWQPSWDADRDGRPDPGAPTWLGRENPDWDGNYKVRYWDPAWQKIIFGTSESYLDLILDAGFDGVYLDIVDAFEYWGPEGESGSGRETAEQDMVDFVRAIAHYARVTRGRTGFGVFPQNGEALVRHPEYLEAVTGIGREDTWNSGNDPQPPEETAFVLAYLDQFRQAGKLVLVIDYATRPALIDDFYPRARTRGFLPYASVRALDHLTFNPGHGPD